MATTPTAAEVKGILVYGTRATHPPDLPPLTSTYGTPIAKDSAPWSTTWWTPTKPLPPGYKEIPGNLPTPFTANEAAGHGWPAALPLHTQLAPTAAELGGYGDGSAIYGKPTRGGFVAYSAPATQPARRRARGLREPTPTPARTDRRRPGQLDPASQTFDLSARLAEAEQSRHPFARGTRASRRKFAPRPPRPSRPSRRPRPPRSARPPRPPRPPFTKRAKNTKKCRHGNKAVECPKNIPCIAAATIPEPTVGHSSCNWAAMDSCGECVKQGCTGFGADLIRSLVKMLPAGWFPKPDPALIAKQDARAAKNARLRKRFNVPEPTKTPIPPAVFQTPVLTLANRCPPGTACCASLTGIRCGIVGPACLPCSQRELEAFQLYGF